jgi:hypothetical protein
VAVYIAPVKKFVMALLGEKVNRRVANDKVPLTDFFNYINMTMKIAL